MPGPQVGPGIQSNLGAGGSQAYDNAVLADSPLAYWKFNETSGTTAADSSGNGHAGTYASVTLGVPGPILVNPTETGVAFNGTTSKMTTSYIPTTVGTIEAWVSLLNLGSVPTSGDICSNDAVYSDNDGFRVFLSGSNQWSAEVGANGSSNETTPSAAILGLLGWYQIVTTYDGTTIRIYQDAVQVGSTTVTGTYTAGSNGIAVGCLQLGSASNFFKGSIAQVSVYSTALSAARILAHYQAATYL